MIRTQCLVDDKVGGCFFLGIPQVFERFLEANFSTIFRNRFARLGTKVPSSMFLDAIARIRSRVTVVRTVQLRVSWV